MVDFKEAFGHITSNSNKLKIVEILHKRANSPKGISKNMRVPERVVKGLLEELLADGVVEKDAETYKLTELGNQIFGEIKGLSERLK
jgi:predicted transcriptional regulator